MDNEHSDDPEVRGAEAVFAEEVRAVLLRVDAPAGFTERVMASAALHRVLLPELPVTPRAPARTGGVQLQFTRPVWRAAYAAAALLAITAGGARVQHQRVEQRRAEAAATQFDQAMQMTGHALDQVSAQLQRTEFGEVQRAFETNGGK